MTIKEWGMIFGSKLKRGLLWFITVLGLSNIYLSPAFAWSGWYNRWNMGPGMMGSWGMGWFGMIFMLVFWIIIIFGIVMVIRWLFQNTGVKDRFGVGANSQAMDILKERYARGEIKRHTFESMKKDLL
jgi:putative membrane protein